MIDFFFFFLVVLKCLQARYKAKVFYTHAGCSLVALNPFQPMPHLYRQDVMKQYHFAPQPQVFTTSHETNCNSRICKYSFSVFKRNMFRAVLCETIAKTFQIHRIFTEFIQYYIEYFTKLACPFGTAMRHFCSFAAFLNVHCLGLLVNT